MLNTNLTKHCFYLSFKYSPVLTLYAELMHRLKKYTYLTFLSRIFLK